MGGFLSMFSPATWILAALKRLVTQGSGLYICALGVGSGQEVLFASSHSDDTGFGFCNISKHGWGGVGNRENQGLYRSN